MRKYNFEKIFARLFIITCSLLITIVILDQASRKVLPPKKLEVEETFLRKNIRKPSPYIMFKGAPYAKAWQKVTQEGQRQDNVLNELGYPDEAPQMPKPANEYRIIVLGGSTIFMGFPPIPRLIQYQFEKKQCYNVKVYNFGVVSSVTSMELARLVYEVVNYSPDLIISYSGFNDIDAPFSADPRPGYPFNYFIFESNPVLDSDIRNYPMVPLIAYGSNLMRYFFPSYFLSEFADLNSLRDKTGYRTAQWKQAIADTYMENMVKSQKISQAFGADFMAFFQPSLYFKDTITSDEKNLINPDQMASSIELRRLILQKSERMKRKNNIYFIDLSDFFDDYQESVFKDRVHLKKYYRPLIAAEIYKYILKFVKENNHVQSNMLSQNCFEHEASD